MNINEFIDYCDKAYESFLINKKDAEYKLDSWKSGSDNLLLVTGMSGGGKSTKAKELGKKYNAIVIEIDLFEHNRFLYTYLRKDKNGDFARSHYTEGEWIIKEYFDKTYGGEKSFTDGATLFNELVKFLKYIHKLSKENRNRKYIIEGVQITELTDEEFKEFEGCPCIIKGTSMLTSMIRRIKRDKDSGDSLLQDPWKLIKFYMNNNKHIESFRNKK